MSKSPSSYFSALMNMYRRAPVNAAFQPTVEIAEGHCVIEFDVQPHHMHAAGAIHGMVYFKALDDATYFAANSVITDVFVLTVGFNLYLLRPVTAGRLRSVGKLVSQSRRLLIADGEVYNGEHLVARGSGSFMLSRTPLGPEIGYALADTPTAP